MVKKLFQAPYRYCLAAVLITAAVVACLVVALNEAAIILALALPILGIGCFAGPRATVVATALSTVLGAAILFFLIGQEVAWRPQAWHALAGVAVVGILAIYISARMKRLHSAIWQGQERLIRLIESVQDTAIFFIDPTGRIETWNPGAERLKGYAPDEVLGKSFSMFYTEDDRANGLPAKLLNQAERNGSVHVEGWRVRKDHSHFWADVTISTIRNDDGKLIGFSKVTRDRTENMALITSLRESEQTLRALLESATQAVVGIREDGTIHIINRTTEKMFGHAAADLIGKPVEMLIPGALRQSHIAKRENFFVNSATRPIGHGIDLTAQHAAGHVFPIEASLSLSETPSGPLAVAFISDITKRKEIEADLLKERSQLRSILDNAPVTVSIKDLEGRFIVANKGLADLLSRSPDQIIGLTNRDIFPELIASAMSYNDLLALRSTTPRKTEEELPLGPNGANRYFLTVRFPVSYLGTAEPFGLCTLSLDITEQKQAEQRIMHAAQHDPLTGLPNRTMIYAIGNQLIELAKRGESRIAVMFFDLDRFKPINDTYGHAVGDKMLQEVARRLKSSVRGSDLVGRLGGDEFVALLANVGTEKDVAQRAANLLETLRAPYHVDSLELRTSPSIGISMYSTDAQDLDTLLRHADAAMYHAKANGRNTYQFFSTEIARNTERVFALEQRLRTSMDDDNFELYYQPIIQTRSREVVSLEALIRWRQKNDELVMPSEFIAAAETSGLILRLGQWVLKNACEQHVQWIAAGLPAMRIAVNVSAIQFQARDFHSVVQETLASSGIDPMYLELELTESTVMKQVEKASKTIAQLKELGIRIALDDFGTGYSSLSYLSQLPIDKLKVDQAFIKHIDTDMRSMAIAETVIALGKRLGVEVVAEGIESENALRLLDRLECDLGQGYVISPPMKAADFPDWYRKRSHKKQQQR